MASMFLVAGFAAAYAGMRFLGLGAGFFYPAFVGAVLVSELVERIPGHVPVVDTWGNTVFAVLLVTAIGTEVAIRRRGGAAADGRWILGAVGAMVVAFTIWNLAKDGTPLCHPHSLLQGHAAWHLLCAVAAYCLYRSWTAGLLAAATSGTERDDSSRAGSTGALRG
ncbi:MAG: hypothetical protein JWO46_2670 [Nocardioidaceae bacterium]|nr:hypothetical protein [Nocardioidaceae bacterium]